MAISASRLWYNATVNGLFCHILGLVSSRFRRRQKFDSPFEFTVINQHESQTGRTVIFEWARIAGSIAQVLMLLIVAGGYYFTVRPLFQHQLLQEEAAKLELEVHRKESLLLDVGPMLKRAEETVQKLQDREAQLSRKIEAAELKLQRTNADFENLLWYEFLEKLQQQSTGPRLRYTFLSNSNDDWRQDSLGIELDENLRLELDDEDNLYRQLVSALETIDTADNGQPFPRYFYSTTETFIEGKRDALRCEPNDLTATDVRYQDEYRELIQRIDEEAGGVSDIQLRKLTIEPRSDLREKYFDSLHERFQKCSGRRLATIKELREMKP